MEVNWSRVNRLEALHASQDLHVQTKNVLQSLNEALPYKAITCNIQNNTFTVTIAPIAVHVQR